MLKNKHKRYTQVQAEAGLAHKIKLLAVREDIEIRVLASAILECVMCDEKKIQEIVNKLKGGMNQ